MGITGKGSDASSLAGAEWIVAELLGPDGELTPIAADIRANAQFVGDRVAGSGGCNRFSGTYQAGDGSLAIGELATTMMACGPEADAVERAVLAALNDTAGYTITDDGLSLTDADGRVLLRLVRSTLTLVGIEWDAIAINNQRGGVASLVIGTSVTARFGEDGQLVGFGGCNRVFGPFEADGASIRIGPVASGRMLCAEPEGLMEQERAYLAALERASTWQIHDGRLQLRDADGALQLDFRPAS